MSGRPLPPFDEVQDELIAQAAGVDAEELHGSLCGFLSAGGALTAAAWPDRLALESIDSARLAPGQPLAQLFAASVEQLDDEGLGFYLLLSESAPLARRAEGLLCWCRGFLGGFGLAAGTAQSDDSAEALADLGRIAGTVLTFEEPEQDAEALEELIEFVRIAVLLLNSDRPQAPVGAATARAH